LTVKFWVVGVRFLDLDFIALKLPCSRLSDELIHFFCTVVKRGAATHRDRNAGWRRRGGRAA
jgi:hypothetical protein